MVQNSCEVQKTEQSPTGSSQASSTCEWQYLCSDALLVKVELRSWGLVSTNTQAGPYYCMVAFPISIDTWPQPKPRNAVLPGQARWKTDFLLCLLATLQGTCV